MRGVPCNLTYSSSVFVACRCIAVGTANSDVQGDVFATVKSDYTAEKSISVRSVLFYTGTVKRRHVLIPRQRCPSLVRYAPSPQVLFSFHPGQVTIGMFLDPLAVSCVVSHSYSVWAAMFGHRTSDVTSGSLNIFHASQTVCKR